MRVALRRLAQAPGFTAICVLTLALGIGATTAVFTLIDAVMLRPLPVPRPAELYRLGNTRECCVNSGLPGSFALFSYDLFTRLRDAAPEFTSLAAFQANVRAMTIGRPDGTAPAETMDSAFVSGNYFQTFEVAPAAGRLLQPSDDRPGAPPVAVLSHRAWTHRFQRRADIVGAPVLLNGVAATIAGVAPEGFYGDTLRPDPPELWVPLADEPVLQPAARLLESRTARWLYAIGRLGPGVPTAPVQSRLTTVVRQWASSLDLAADERRLLPQQHVEIVSAAGGVNNMRDRVSPALKLLQGVAGAVLLIACANLANLLLARGLGRRTERAVRAALGASRFQLVAESLVECLLLACAGGALGLLVSYGAAREIIGLAFRGATDIPVNPWPSPTAVGFAFVVSLATGVLFGIAPALVGARSDPMDAMRGAGRTTGERGSAIRRSLIALQIALSLVLITSAGLLGQSLKKLQAQDFGFRTEGRYVAILTPTSIGLVPQDQLESLYRRMQERLLRVPGVVNAGYSLYSPMSGDNWASSITVDGHDTSERLNASWDRVSPRYFDTIGTPVLRGRAIDERDRPASPPVAVVSQGFARKFFGDANPIGRRIGFANASGSAPRVFEIVGVVGDAKYQNAWMAPYPTFFLPFLQETPINGTLAGGGRLDRSHYPVAIELETTAANAGLEREIRAALADVDRRLILRTVVAMDEQVAQRFNVERLVSRLTVAFGVVALLLACLGLYGVTAHWVTRRTREIGIRMAVGASRTRIVRTVLGGAAVQLAIGVAIGLPASFAAGQSLRARLFGLSAHDPMVVSTALLVLTAASIAAAVIPALRAAAVDPVTALRSE